jgi:hypothetical protein
LFTTRTLTWLLLTLTIKNIISNINSQIKFNKLQVSHVKLLLFVNISSKLKPLNINNSGSLEFWKVNGKKVDEQENNLEKFSTEDVIKANLGDVYITLILSQQIFY